MVQDTPTATRAIMPTLPKANRRKFLIGTGAAIGLVIGYVVWPRHPKLNLSAAKDEAIVNGWLKIGTDGRVVVIVPQAEMGQGVYTSLPMIVADELGVAWESVSVEPAPLHPLYANFNMTEDAVAPMPKAMQGVAAWGLRQLIDRYSMHITGGSTSVRSYHDTLRLAGASARDMLRKAAARQWGVDWLETEAFGGMVHHGDKSLRYADLAPKAAAEDAPSAPVLKSRDKFNIVGNSVPRLDVPSKVDGTAIYGADVRLPDMVYAAIRHGPIGGGKIGTYDKQAIGANTEVLGVVEGHNWLAVVGKRYWAARTVLDPLKIEFDQRAADQISTDWVHGRLKSALKNGKPHVYETTGDVDGALKGEGTLVSANYEVPYLAHACLEPMTATARANTDGTLEIWAPTQSITLVAMGVAKALDMAQDKIRVYPTFVGGGFGRKAESDVCIEAALIARQMKRPVQLIWSREEDMRAGRFRPMALAKLSGVVDKSGTVSAFDVRAASQSTSGSFLDRNLPAIANHEPDEGSVQGLTKMPYDFGAMRVAHVMDKMAIPVGFWRSVGHSQNAFFVEAFVDELAHAAKQDPLQFRLAHLTKSPRHAKVLQTAADKAGPLVAGRGRGYALHESFGSIVAQVADVTVSDSGELSVKRVVCAVDCGDVIHPDTVVGQMEGGIIFALSAALHGQIGFAHGVTEQSNFDGYPLVTLAETPEISVEIIRSGHALGGIGEVAVPPLAPALTNAIFNATGVRVRQLPLDGQHLVTEEQMLRAKQQKQTDKRTEAEHTGSKTGVPDAGDNAATKAGTQ